MTTQPTAADQFLLGAGGRSAQFLNIGDTVTGTIARPPEVRQQTKMGSGEPMFWDNGDPMNHLVVPLQTALREDDDDDGIRNLYVKGAKDPASKSLHSAVAAAVTASGAKGLAVGGTLTMRHTGTHPAKTAGYNPVKEYEATYAPPSGAEFLGTTQTPAAPAAQPAAPQAAAPSQPATAAGPTPEAVAAVKAAGLDPAVVFAGQQLPPGS